MKTTFTAIAALTASAGLAVAATFSFTAELEGSNEVPPNDSPAVGGMNGTFDDQTNIFNFSWEISDTLEGTPAAPGAHIHQGGPDENGPIVFAMSMGEWDLEDTASWEVPTDLVDDLFSGNLYLNFHTTAYPGGEVRGQIVPTPGVAAILGVGGLVATRRRR
jgi:hypothetical protein